ncbi:MAG TPA: RNA-binding protein [Acidobacteriaceae bacterium]
MKKLYVGNLSFDASEEELRQLFEPHGTVESAKVATDRDTGRSRGFGFIEMTSDSEAESAISALNGTQVGGRALIVNEARPKASGFGGGGYGGGRSGGRDGNRGRSGKGGGGGYRY